MYKRQAYDIASNGTLENARVFYNPGTTREPGGCDGFKIDKKGNVFAACLLYTSDAADERSSVDLGGRRIIKKKKRKKKKKKRSVNIRRTEVND